MRRFLLMTILTSALTAAGMVETTWAGGGAHHPALGVAQRRGCIPMTNWHGSYYEAAWGMPVALVVPPTSEMQTKWGWGVGNTRVVPIWPQFSRNYPGPGQYDPRLFKPTPAWPSHTDQFGVYYVRGPW